jgi:uroporphyrinogen III methyltransferase/synthase
MKGKAYLVGAGPGDPGLLTVRAKELIEAADVLIYDYLSNAEFLQWAKPGAEILYAGKMASQHTLTQEEINARLVAAAKTGKCVVRLKGGDPYVFGRGGEEAQALKAEGLDFEVVPGITSGIAAPAYAGIPVTHRDHTSMVTFITGHEDPTKEESSLDWALLAKLKGTRVFFMGVERLRAITGKLIENGASPETPVALIRWGTRPQQQTVAGTLATISEIVERTGFKPPAITVVGDVVNLREELDWFEQRPLFGQRVVVTRTRQQASGLSKLLREAGAEVLEIPTIRVSPVTLESDQEETLRKIAEEVDWIMFTSPNAVDYFFAQFFAQHRDIRALGAVKIAAVGPATRLKLAERHLGVEVQPEEFTAEALGRCFTAVELRGRRILLPRGNLAEPLLPDHLRSLGAEVSEWVVYRTEPEPTDCGGLRARFEKEGADWITFTSSSTARHWKDLNLQVQPGGRVPRHLSMGPQTTLGMTEAGLEVALEAEMHTIPGLVAALQNLVQQERNST